jgi:hypothetical protein
MNCLGPKNIVIEVVIFCEFLIGYNVTTIDKVHNQVYGDVQPTLMNKIMVKK